jgi:hypothetical protein
VNKTNKKTAFKIFVLTFLLLPFLLTGCSTADPKKDPLKHSRKLIKEGHSSLYNNGAFQVPNTEIKLIPAGETPLRIAGEMMGMRARQAFLTSLKNAADSVYLIPVGTKLSLDYAKNIKKKGEQLGGNVTEVTRPVGALIINRSFNFTKDTTLESWEFGKKAANAMRQYGIDITENAAKSGDEITDSMTNTGKKLISESWVMAKDISGKSNSEAKKSILYAGNTFIKGYAAVPENLSQRAKSIAKASNPDHFTKAITNANTERGKYSGIMTDLIVNTTGNYIGDVQGSFVKAKDSFKDSISVTGFGLAFLKSARWVLQGTLWDGLVKPISKIGAASVGYVAVNLAVFPTMVVVNEGIAATNLAIEVSWNTAGTAYDLVAPSATAAVASIYSLFQYTAGNLAAGTTATGMAILGGSTVVAGQIAGNTVKGAGYISGKGVNYIGVPIAAAGITLGAGTVGVVAGGAGAVAGSTLIIGGEAASATTQVFGNLLAATTLATGTTASVVASATVGVYELSKAIIVPTGYELGGGIVLGYGTISQLGAQSILAVADASYLVLSLEGPRWVIYAVKGNLGNGDDLPPGTLLDLKSMQKEGDELYYLPVSDKEMKSVIDHVYPELPVAPVANKNE